MAPDEAYVLSLYENMLKRAPASAEFEHWVQLMRGGQSSEALYYAFVHSEEYKAKHRIVPFFPLGHFHSPIVDPDLVTEYVDRERATQSNRIAGISVPMTEMVDFWQRLSNIISRTPFPETRFHQHRFFYDNETFPYGDAISLRAIMADVKPKRVIEIGSGFSSACMLDCADEFGFGTHFTLIDPNPERVKALLRPDDYSRVKIVAEPAQSTEIELYKQLQRSDILFIDSTHVIKTASDVHFELFHILPALASGVVIHFHDIQFPFEYPDQWILSNYSWNEIYAVRAFLMYNDSFRIRFWGSCLARENPQIVEAVIPQFLKNPGGSLWIEKI